MKKLHLIYFLCLCLFTSNGQNNNDIIIGKTDSLNSKILKEQRKIWVHVPKEYSDGLIENKNYPVVYLLDGDTHFHAVVGMIKQLSSLGGGSIFPKMIVVGILNTNRTRDLTPTKGKLDSSTDSNMIANSGGGENFMLFIEKELIPYMESNYPTDLYRTFIGHSFGGLTVMNTLIEKPNLFNSYVSIDPSMSWDNKKLLSKIKETSLDGKYSNKNLFLGIANTMSEDMDTVTVKKDTTAGTRHIRAILELNDYLKNDTQKNISFKGEYYKDDHHGSVPLIAVYDAMRFIFEFYLLKLDFVHPKSVTSKKVENHYKRLSKEFGREIKPEEELSNMLGYWLMSKKEFENSEQFFNLNVKNYPESFNAYDSLGDFYLAIENKEKAIENYKKSVSLNIDSLSKDKLKELENKE
jgi:predicted alpha/beta superfamily hydrolase